ncbi:MAG: dihydroxyacetone kinase phosphoryl donor subunit DhaM [Acidimicrobiales bacterium]
MDRASPDPGPVSVVLVSHSHEVATGTAELVAQIAGPMARIIAVGGARDGGLGTDGQKVVEALRCAACAGGVVVVVDIGSSVMTVRAAVAELEPVKKTSIILADAPFVEGAIAAAVSAAMGAPLEEVAEAAGHARHATKL